LFHFGDDGLLANNPLLAQGRVFLGFRKKAA